MRLLDGLSALPQVEDVHSDALSPGAWCAGAPMWANPLMPGGAGQVLDVDFADLASSGITTIAELAAAAVAVTVASNREEFLVARAIHLPQNWPAFLDRHRTRQQLHLCVARLPQPWLEAAQNHTPPPASAFHEVALPRLGWRLPLGIVHLEALSVRQATQAQLGGCAGQAAAALRGLRGSCVSTQRQASPAARGACGHGHTPSAGPVAAPLGQWTQGGVLAPHAGCLANSRHAGMQRMTSAAAGCPALTACTTSGLALQQPHCRGSLRPTCSGEGCCRAHSRPSTSCLLSLPRCRCTRAGGAWCAWPPSAPWTTCGGQQAPGHSRA